MKRLALLASVPLLLAASRASSLRQAAIPSPQPPPADPAAPGGAKIEVEAVRLREFGALTTASGRVAPRAKSALRGESVVVADVYERSRDRIPRGSRVRVSVAAFPGRFFDGVVERAPGPPDPDKHTAEVRCLIADDAPEPGLEPGAVATVNIMAPGELAPALPRSAVLHAGTATAAYFQIVAIVDGKPRFERRPIVVDEDMPGDHVRVVAGAVPGDRVVSSGAILLSVAR